MLCNLDLFRAVPMLIRTNFRDGYHLTPLQFIPVPEACTTGTGRTAALAIPTPTTSAANPFSQPDA